MLYKPDLQGLHDHMRAFWAYDFVDRCGLQIRAKRADFEPLPDDKHVDLMTRRTDVDYVLDRAERKFGNYHYLADAAPVYIPGLVCSDTAAFIAEDIDVEEGTVWYPRIIHDWDSFELRFNPQNRWWQLVRQMTEAAAERAKDRYLVGVPDFQPGMDTISLLRSAQKVCLDLFDNPEPVKRAASFVLDEIYAYTYREIRSIVARHSPVISDWLGLVSAGNHDIIQCDFIALVSPRHFEEFCLPLIRRQCQMLDTSVYHLDGPDSVRHLDRLLEVEELGAIQWVPGAGREPAVAWTKMLRRVQRARKGLCIHTPAADVEAILEELSPRGLMINVSDVFESTEEAQAFIRRVEKWSARSAAANP